MGNRDKRERKKFCVIGLMSRMGEGFIPTPRGDRDGGEKMPCFLSLLLNILLIILETFMKLTQEVIDQFQ